MKTLILNGSPRKNGDTASLLALVREALPGEILEVRAYSAAISPCVDCRFCWQHPGCSIQDEMQPVYDFIQDCDNVLLASPIYFSELTGKLLDLASRLQTYYAAKAFRQEVPIRKPKKGAVILVGGGDGRMDRALQTARIILRQMNCREIHDPVCSLRTNVLPASEDAQARQGAIEIAAYFHEDAKS